MKPMLTNGQSDSQVVSLYRLVLFHWLFNMGGVTNRDASLFFNTLL